MYKQTAVSTQKHKDFQYFIFVCDCKGKRNLYAFFVPPFFPQLFFRKIKVNNASLFEFLLDVNIHFPSLRRTKYSYDVFCLVSYVSLMVPLEFLLSFGISSVCLRSQAFAYENLNKNMKEKP
jgi:hypothetical protein